MEKMHHEEYLIVNEFGFSKWYKTDKFRTISRIESIN
jgi:hypothetical protein